MSLDQQRLADYLSHILEAIDRINRYTQDMDKLVFLSNLLVQDAVIHNLVVMARRATILRSITPTSLLTILSCRYRSLIRCAMLSRTVISRWTLTSSGELSTMTFRDFISR